MKLLSVPEYFALILESLRRLEHHLGWIAFTIATRTGNVMSALDDLTAQVAANTTVEASAVTLIQGLAKQLSDIIAAGNDSAALEALAASMKGSADALGAAITANTPAAPAPAPTP